MHGVVDQARTPSVSVVTCFLNAHAHLTDAIASVRDQVDADWELILVDDGSTDGSTTVAEEAAERDPARIRYFEHEGHANLGKSSSRNVGLRHARGRHVVFLDADDVLLPHKLSHQAALLDANPHADALYGRTLYWDGRAGSPPSGKLSRIGVSWSRVHEPPELFVEFIAHPGIVPCLCALMARRKMLAAVGGFDEAIQDLYEDQVLLAKVALHASVYVDLRCGEKYRQHADSSSSRAIAAGAYHPWRPNPARRSFLEWVAGYVGDHPAAASPRVEQALARARRPYASRLQARLAPLAYASKAVRDRITMAVRPEPRAGELA
jgi:glycosyltransferase involved in cell wall biosynthesis